MISIRSRKSVGGGPGLGVVVGDGVVERTVDVGEEEGGEDEGEDEGSGVDEAPGVVVGVGVGVGVVTAPPPPVEAEDMMTANERKKRKLERIWGMMGMGERKQCAKRRHADVKTRQPKKRQGHVRKSGKAQGGGQVTSIWKIKIRQNGTRSRNH
jgi:hypothetical protein